MEDRPLTAREVLRGLLTLPPEERCPFRDEPGPPQNRGGVKAVMIAFCVKHLDHKGLHKLRIHWEILE